jgi:L-2,4-diaminobutyrate decarboxylase
MWDTAEYERLANTAIRSLASYVEQSQAGEGHVVSVSSLPELAEELELRRLIREGGLGEENFERWLATMLARTTRLHHPGELAHQVAPPDIPSALADLVHGPTN